jgi:hypothetical protein
MLQETHTPAGTVRPGTRIRIDTVQCAVTPSRAFPDGIDHQAKALEGKEGTVTDIDDAGQLGGTWGGLRIIPGADRFTVLAD